MKSITFSGDISDADPSDVILTKATLRGIVGAGMNLRDAILVDAELTDADLSNAGPYACKLMQNYVEQFYQFLQKK